jgi:hypothetical protein
MLALELSTIADDVGAIDSLALDEPGTTAEDDRQQSYLVQVQVCLWLHHLQQS